MSAAFPAKEIMFPPKNLVKAGQLGFPNSRRSIPFHRRDKITKNHLRERIVGHPLRMPLHAHHPLPRAFELNAFHNSISRPRRYAQSLSGFIDRLMMAAIDMHVFGARKLEKPASRRKRRAMFRVAFSHASRQ